MNELSLTVERTIAAPQKDVFNAWLDPKMLACFMMPAPNMSVPHASTEPSVGGRFEILMKTEENEIPHSGTYLEITPHERIVFTWESPFSVDGSTVTLTFSPTDAGTHLQLTHIRFADEQMRENHQGGWTRILEALDSQVGS